MNQHAKSEIRRYLLEAGLDAAGFAKPQISVHQCRRWLEFIQNREYGTMSWLANRAEIRLDPQKLLPDVKTVIAAGINYAPPPLYRNPAFMEHGVRISLYAANKDYHEVLKHRLHKACQQIKSVYGGKFRVFVDTGPVMEKVLASAAGIGGQGKNTLLISPQFGPWLFLGIILTDLELPADTPIADLCGNCTLCLKACPTGALYAPYCLNPQHCLAYFTIEYKNIIPEQFRRQLGNRIYGCDTCLLACPKSQAVETGHETALQPQHITDYSDPISLLDLDPEKFSRIFARSPIKRIGLPKLLSNVLIALGNLNNSSIYRKHIEPFCGHDSPIIRDSARWAMQYTKKQPA